jgi:hypothetical protein
MTFTELHRLHVRFGILPDLGVDQTGKQQGEQAFRQAVAGEGTISANGFANFLAAPENQFA